MSYFTERRDQRRATEGTHHDLAPNSQQISSSDAATLDLPISATNPTKTLRTSTLDQSDPSYNTEPNLDDISFDIDAMDGLLSGSNTSGSAFDTPSIRSQFIQDLELPSPGAAQTSSSHSAMPLNLAFSNNVDLLPSRPSDAQNQSSHGGSDLSSSRLDDTANLSSVLFSTDGGWLSTLHIAAQKGNDRIVRVLMQRSVDCNEKDSDGRTPLVYAVIEDHEAVVSSLLAHGARLSEVDREGRSALH